MAVRETEALEMKADEEECRVKAETGNETGY